MNKNNHEDNTNKARHNIYEYAQKNSEKHIKKIDEMRSSKEKMTFKNSVRYLVWSPPIGLIICLLTPIFLGMYGKYFYFSIEDKYQSIEKQRLLIPSSLLITWILIIFVFILLIISFIEKLI